jgi:hypothetical protein
MVGHKIFSLQGPAFRDRHSSQPAAPPAQSPPNEHQPKAVAEWSEELLQMLASYNSFSVIDLVWSTK